MLLYNGEVGEPCGTPIFVGCTLPLWLMPILSVCLINFSRLPSDILRLISSRSLLCGIRVSKPGNQFPQRSMPVDINLVESPRWLAWRFVSAYIHRSTPEIPLQRWVP